MDAHQTCIWQYTFYFTFRETSRQWPMSRPSPAVWAQARISSPSNSIGPRHSGAFLECFLNSRILRYILDCCSKQENEALLTFRCTKCEFLPCVFLSAPLEASLFFIFTATVFRTKPSSLADFYFILRRFRAICTA